LDDADRRTLIDEWFRRYAGRLLAYLLHRTDPQTAQDVLQEVFVIAFGKADQIADAPLGWLFGTGRRVLANRQRGIRRRDQLVARLMDDVGREPDPETADLKLAFAQTLATLSPADREVLTLTGWYELTPTQAAEALGCTPSAYAVRLHRARRRLAAALDGAGYRGDTTAGQLAEALRG
jgi:RNA polymerase sigma-70 factor (ECF subfamily)